MAMWIDSADVARVRQAVEDGLVVGVTTNPAILASTGRPPLEVIEELLRVCPGTVFYQLQAEDLQGRRLEAERALALGRNVGLKIACTPENLGLAARFAKDHVVGITSIFSAAQAAMAAQVGAAFVLPYVNRSTRLLGDGPGLVRQMRGVLQGSRTEIVAASVKDPDEAVATLLAGAHHLTLPPDVLAAMGRHPLSEQAIEQFAQAVRGS